MSENTISASNNLAQLFAVSSAEVFFYFATPIIALFAFWFSYLQYCASQNSLKEKLFERRLLIFNAIREYLFSVKLSGTVGNRELQKLDETIVSSKFLFGPEVSLFLTQIRCESMKLRRLESQIRSNSDKNKVLQNQVKLPANVYNERDETFDSLLDQEASLVRIFEPYMGFGKIK